MSIFIYDNCFDDFPITTTFAIGIVIKRDMLKKAAKTKKINFFIALVFLNFIQNYIESDIICK